MRKQLIVLGIAAIPFLSACGADEPAPAAAPAPAQSTMPATPDNTNTDTDEPAPDLILPENE